MITVWMASHVVVQSGRRKQHIHCEARRPCWLDFLDRLFTPCVYIWR